MLSISSMIALPDWLNQIILAGIPLCIGGGTWVMRTTLVRLHALREQQIVDLRQDVANAASDVRQVQRTAHEIHGCVEDLKVKVAESATHGDRLFRLENTVLEWTMRRDRRISDNGGSVG